MLTFAFFRRWRYLIITYGSTRTSLFSTWWSKYPFTFTFSKNSPFQTLQELIKLSNVTFYCNWKMSKDDNDQIALIGWAERRKLQIFMPLKKLFCSQSIGVFSDLAGFGPAVGCFAKTTELSPTSVSPWNPWLLLSFCHRCQGSRPHHPHHHLHHSQGPHRPHHCHLARLTLVLSCAMNFKNYPHDEQLCNLKIESSKFSSKSAN